MAVLNAKEVVQANPDSAFEVSPFKGAMIACYEPVYVYREFNFLDSNYDSIVVIGTFTISRILSTDPCYQIIVFTI